MIIKTLKNTRSAKLKGFSTNLLIGESNTGSKETSLQITTVLPNGMQYLHSHIEDQCYYIISGSGTMFVGDEIESVTAGYAIFVPSNAEHGIKNNGKNDLTYITTNRAFGISREMLLWPIDPK